MWRFRSQEKKIPLSEFHGWLKCHRPEQRDALGDIVFSHAFPFFAGDEGHLELDPVDQMLESVAPEMGFAVVRLPEPTRAKRRFAGDQRSLLFLDRGRYYTICSDAQGYDNDTLANEMNAYCDPRRGGFAFVLDLISPNPLGERRPGWIEVMVSDIPGAPSLALSEAQRAGLVPADYTRAAALVVCKIEETTIDGVLDLRRPEARQWLFDTFAHGEPDWFDYQGQALPQGTGFLHLLPTLMDRQNGGNDFTDVIGAYLQSKGVSALIFPSARSDVFVTVENGEVGQSHGWNLVDYRDAPLADLARKVVWLTTWGRFPDPGTRIEAAELNGRYAGSFRVQGNEAHHNLLRHLLLCFAVWKHLGEEKYVQGYRWHATRAVTKPDGKAVAVVCIDCGHSSEMDALFDIPDACPACGSKAVSVP